MHELKIFARWEGRCGDSFGTECHTLARNHRRLRDIAVCARLCIFVWDLISLFSFPKPLFSVPYGQDTMLFIDGIV